MAEGEEYVAGHPRILPANERNAKNLIPGASRLRWIVDKLHRSGGISGELRGRRVGHYLPRACDPNKYKVIFPLLLL